jgi:hypothetical protein
MRHLRIGKQASVTVEATEDDTAAAPVEARHGRKTLMLGTHQRVVVSLERFLRQQGVTSASP